MEPVSLGTVYVVPFAEDEHSAQAVCKGTLQSPLDLRGGSDSLRGFGRNFLRSLPTTESSSWHYQTMELGCCEDSSTIGPMREAGTKLQLGSSVAWPVHVKPCGQCCLKTPHVQKVGCGVRDYWGPSELMELCLLTFELGASSCSTSHTQSPYHSTAFLVSVLSKVSLCWLYSPRWFQNHPPVSASLMLGLQVCVAMPRAVKCFLLVLVVIVFHSRSGKQMLWNVGSVPR